MWLIGGLPALFMSVMTLWASIMNQVIFTSKSTLLQVINILVIFIVTWVIFESVIKFFSNENKVKEDTVFN